MTDYFYSFASIGVTTLFTVAGIACIILLACLVYLFVKSTFFR